MMILTLILALLAGPDAHAFGKKPADPVPPSKPPTNPTKPSEPGTDCSKHISRSEWQNWADNIRDSGGRVPAESAYPNTADGFKKYLAYAGASSARAAEMTLPANSSAAKKCGLANMLPNRCLWIRGAALALWADRLAKLTGASTKIRNWNRPSCYNSAVGGAKSSDHIQARSIDLYFSGTTTRRKAQNSLCSLWAANNMQVGMGGSMLHIGFQSPAGRRFWYYASYSDNDRNSNCYAKGSARSLEMAVPLEHEEDHEH